jgi:hypothetical protein
MAEEVCILSARRIAQGFDQFGRRQFGRSYAYSVPTPQVVYYNSITLQITNPANTVIGKIFSDCQRPLLKEIKFTIDQNGCADFSFVLNRQPEFPVIPFSIVRVFFNYSLTPVYTGLLEYTPELSAKEKDVYEYSGFGLRKQLDRVTGEKTYTAPKDVGVIVDDLVSTYVQPDTAIGYDTGKIDTSTGVVTANDLNFTKDPVAKSFDALSKMANYDWGVDEEGELYFEAKPSSTVKTLYIGYQLQSFDPKLNIDEVYNNIYILRKQSSGNGAGWTVGSIDNDTTSQAKYGLRILEYQMPGYFSDTDCGLVGDVLLAEKKDPKYSADVKGYKIDSTDDFFERGDYRFVMPLKRYQETIDDCEDSGDWAKTGAGDLAISNDTSILISGAKSIKLSYTNATNDLATLTTDFTGELEIIRLFIRSGLRGEYLTLGVGASAWNEYTTTIPIEFTSRFIAFEWDVSELEIDEITKLGIRIDSSGTANNIYIDQIDATLTGHKHYTLEFKRAKYSLTPQKNNASVEFGPVPPRMYEYVSNILKLAEENKYMAEKQ